MELQVGFGFSCGFERQQQQEDGCLTTEHVVAAAG